MQSLLAPLSLFLLVVAAEPPRSLEVEVTGLRSHKRSHKGLLQVCLTRDPGHFPDCAKDPKAITQTVSASARQIRFSNVARGKYAVALFHDANANGRLDKMLGIPREGFGFSRNPKIRFGAPGFEEVRIEVTAPVTRTAVRLQYLP
jgi:uncharacterized protein (DUF2141 family)